MASKTITQLTILQIDTTTEAKSNTRVRDQLRITKIITSIKIKGKNGRGATIITKQENLLIIAVTISLETNRITRVISRITTAITIPSNRTMANISKLIINKVTTNNLLISMLLLNTGIKITTSNTNKTTIHLHSSINNTSSSTESPLIKPSKSVTTCDLNSNAVNNRCHLVGNNTKVGHSMTF